MVCKMSAFLMQFIQLAFYLFFYVIFFKNLKRLEVVYIALSVSLPLVLACVPFITHSYNLAGAWCYISSGDQDCSMFCSYAVFFSKHYGKPTTVMYVECVTILYTCRKSSYISWHECVTMILTCTSAHVSRGIQ